MESACEFAYEWPEWTFIFTINNNIIKHIFVNNDIREQVDKY